MKLNKILCALASTLALSACASTDLASRDVPFAKAISAAETNHIVSSDWNVADVRVTVPASLPTTEMNVYYPRADIVWHGDPVGNRHQQVRRIMDDGLTAGLAGLRGSRRVYVDVTVVRFHSLSPKTRKSIGGVHNMIFDLSVRDAKTGKVLVPTQRHKVDLKALGGRRAITAEQQGFTQKYRIKAHLQEWIAEAMSVPQSLRVTKTAAN